MKPEKKEHVLAGLVGAFLGSLIGTACIVGIGQLGYVASLSGLVMAVCAIKGYSLLGGVMSRKGAVIACVLTVIMTYFGNRLDFAVSVARAAEVDVFTVFQAMGQLLDAGYINTAAYWGNLIMLYLFTLLGAVPTLIAAFRRATPVSVPQQAADGSAAPPTAETEESTAQLYPFAGLSWTRRLRLSLCLPIFLPILVIAADSFVLYSRYGENLNSSIPMIAALLGATIGLIVSAVWMLSRLYSLQSPQFVFVRMDGELWRVDLAKFNLFEPYRFTAKSGAIRLLRWDILTEEEQQQAHSAIQRAIRSIRAGEIMQDSMLRRIVLYLPDPRLEKETTWTWKISYALNTGTGGRRKTMTIGKVYAGLVPAPGASAPEGPVPARWSLALLPLALTVLLALVGWGIGLSLSGQTGSGGNETSIPEVRPESVVSYEQNGIQFQIDSSFEDLDGAGQFMDPATGTVYMIGVQQGANAETALDVLLRPIGDARVMDTYQDFSFAYPYEEEDLVDLEAEDGTVYQHNLLTIHFTDGQTFHSAVSLSESGTLIQVMAVQNSRDQEEPVKGMIRYLLTTLTPAGTDGQGGTSV